MNNCEATSQPGSVPITDAPITNKIIPNPGWQIEKYKSPFHAAIIMLHGKFNGKFFSGQVNSKSGIVSLRFCGSNTKKFTFQKGQKFDDFVIDKLTNFYKRKEI